MIIKELRKNRQFDSLQELFADRDRWCQHALARNVDGKACDVFEGTSWCLSGGIILLYHYSTYVINYVHKHLEGYDYVGQWNDETVRKVQDIQRFVRELGL